MINLDDQAPKEKVQKQVKNFLLVISIGCGLIWILTMFFWKQGYTRGSIIKLEQKRELEYWERRGMTNKTLKKHLNSKKIRNLSVFDQIKKLIKRKYLVLVIINYGLGFGSVVAGGTLLTQLLYSLDYSPVKYSKFCFI